MNTPPCSSWAHGPWRPEAATPHHHPVVAIRAGRADTQPVSVVLKRYSPTHLEASVAIRGRGWFFSRTADGSWWSLRLRPRRCSEPPSREDPPDGGVREPPRPGGPPLGPGRSLQLP